MLKEENVAFSGDVVESSGRAFLRALVDSLWCLDGHHDVLKKQGCPIPELFIVDGPIVGQCQLWVN